MWVHRLWGEERKCVKGRSKVGGRWEEGIYDVGGRWEEGVYDVGGRPSLVGKGER